ncbi:C-type lectin domain containing protein [Elysia marginata]|uniref:C-type lectin domain containing protein n=1 Tax=Elysia marginata TaxID=1093978 RepID=A0AAV4EG11_9GAST|nr:C-type lectin domain containing protein [Elysia marginata]
MVAGSGDVPLYDAAGSILYEFKNRACGDEYEMYEYWSGSQKISTCLYFEEESRTNFPLADWECRKKDGSLASAKSLEKCAMLRQICPDDQFWVGLERRGNVFAWKQDDSVMSPEQIEELFVPGYPRSSSSGTCVKMDRPPTTKLKNYPCQFGYKYFCEAKPGC